MPNFNTYIADFCDEIKQTSEVIRYLKQWTDPIAKKAGFTEALFHFPRNKAVTPLINECLVYIVPFGYSLLINKMKWSGKAAALPSPVDPHQGLTLFGSGETGSEVYAKMTDPKAFAALIFHEMMHNKLQLGQTLHGKFQPCSFSCREMKLEKIVNPTPQEAAAMVTALKKPIKQYTGGLDTLWLAGERKRRDPDSGWQIELS